MIDTATLWTLLGAALVFFMQAGFAMVETGFTRAKNAGNIIMKNLMDFALGTIVFWFLGYGLMLGDSVGGIIGKPELFDFSDPTTLIFQTVFAATAATIVSGAMAERTKFISYCLYSVAISLFIYPISAHWIWATDINGDPAGWLGKLGFIDFAGSTAVHMVGGVAALVGAKILGARIGKYDKKGKSRAIPGHSITLGALGVFILWFGWFGFNGGTTLGTGNEGMIFVTTNIAAAVSTTAVMIITWLLYKKPDVSMTLNGTLAGLVAITAGCNAVNPIGAALIGLIAGFVVVFGIEFIDKVLKIDDPVGAIGVHGLCGALGTLLVGFFALDGGVFYGGGFKLLGVQALGVVSVASYVAVMMFLVFMLIKHTVGLRVSKEEEIIGLDIKEHGLVSAYADFTFAPSVGNFYETVEDTKAVPVEQSVTVSDTSTPAVKSSSSKAKITKIVILTRQSKFEVLKAALTEIGITGMTVTQVLGCGTQKGANEYYRGVKLEMDLLPKIKVEVIVSKVPVSTVVNTTKKILYTGHIGDGKIFIYDVEDVIKVRTGATGFDALQDE